MHVEIYFVKINFDIIGIFLSVIFFVELTLLPRIWVLLEAASLFAGQLILVNNSLGIS